MRWEQTYDCARRHKNGITKALQEIVGAQASFSVIISGLTDHERPAGKPGGMTLEELRRLTGKSRDHLSRALKAAESLNAAEVVRMIGEQIREAFSRNDALVVMIEHTFCIPRGEAEEIVLGGDA